MATAPARSPDLQKIRQHAFESLHVAQRLTTNLYVDERIHEKGAKLGPDFQNIVAERNTILVFADHEPLANFGHSCTYLLYEAENGNYYREAAARFPPYTVKPPATLKAFHSPVQFTGGQLYHIPPIFRCPIIVPDGTRYAILYSGMSNMRHLNDLEFAYRMLVDRYGFSKNNIYALSYDGTLNTQDGPASVWPGDGTAYRIKITGQGNQAAFEAAFKDLKGKLKADDLLFIHTNNHGDNYGSGSFLCTYPSWGTYTATDFCNDLATLPKYRSLIVMMEQCNSGGFNAPVIAKSTAAATSIASAAIATQSSWASPDGHWDSFARDWIAAQMGHDPYGAALAFNPDTNLDGAIEATEAFNYANSVKNPSDTPNYNQSSAAGGNITLDQAYTLWWIWCWLFLPEIERYRIPLPTPPDPEFYAKVLGISGELQKSLVPAIDKGVAEIRRALAPQIQAAFEKTFGRAKQGG